MNLCVYLGVNFRGESAYFLCFTTCKFLIHKATLSPSSLQLILPNRVLRSPSITADSNVPILLEDVGCNGTETSLVNCDVTWNRVGPECGHNNDSGVVCTDGRPCTSGYSSSISVFLSVLLYILQDILVIFCCTSGYSSKFLSPYVDFAVRLVDGGDVPNQGRVEVYHDGEWGSICDDFFGFEEAVVICHELGFPGADDSHG